MYIDGYDSGEREIMVERYVGMKDVIKLIVVTYKKLLEDFFTETYQDRRACRNKPTLSSSLTKSLFLSLYLSRHSESRLMAISLFFLVNEDLNSSTSFSTSRD